MIVGFGPRTASTMQNSLAPNACVSSAAARISSASRNGVALTGVSNLADCEQKWQSSGQPPVLADKMPSTSTSGPHQARRTSWASAASEGTALSGRAASAASSSSVSWRRSSRRASPAAASRARGVSITVIARNGSREGNRSLLGRFRCDAGGVRADRLVAILLMLQAARPGHRGRGGGRARGVRAHGAPRPRGAGHGRGARSTRRRAATAGGSSAGGGRTDLSGLNAAEARALFLVAGPSSSATPEVKAALRKLVRALPEPFRARRRGGVDGDGRRPGRLGPAAAPRPPPPHLDAVQQAVIEGEQLALGYVAPRPASRAARRAPARPRSQGAVLVPRRRHRGRAAHLPGRPHHVGRADRRARRAARRASTWPRRGS